MGSESAKIDWENVGFYPFKLDGPLCPLLDDGDLLLEFYDKARGREGIKAFCKKKNWKKKPRPPGVVVGSNELKPLLQSLFNSPVARELLNRYRNAEELSLNNSILSWLRIENAPLEKRIVSCCNKRGKHHYLDSSSLKTFLSDLVKEDPGVHFVKHLAYIILGFAIWQKEDRYSIGSSFLTSFPEFAQPFGICHQDDPARIMSEDIQKDNVIEQGLNPADASIEQSGNYDFEEAFNSHKELSTFTSLIQKIKEAKFSFVESAEDCTHRMNRLSETVKCADEEIEELLLTLRRRRDDWNSLCNRVDDLNNGIMEVSRQLEKKYPFHVSLPEFSLSQPQAFSAQALDEWEGLLSNSIRGLVDVGRDFDSLKKWDGIRERYESIVLKAQGLSLSESNELPELHSQNVQWKDRANELLQIETKYRAEIDDLLSRIQGHEARLSHIEDLRQRLSKIQIGDNCQDLLAEGDLIDIAELASNGDVDMHPEFIGILVYVISERALDDGATLLLEVLDNYQNDLIFCCNLIATLPLQLLHRLMKSDSRISRVIFYYTFAYSYITSSFTVLTYFQTAIDKTDLHRSKSFFEALFTLISSGELKDQKQIHVATHTDGEIVKEIDEAAIQGCRTFLENEPGMKGGFHILRSCAWNLYFRELAHDVKCKKTSRIEARLSNLRQMGEDAIWRKIVDSSEMKPSEKSALKRRKSDPKYQKTVKYIEDGIGHLKAVINAWKHMESRGVDQWNLLRNVIQALETHDDVDFGCALWLEGSVRNLIDHAVEFDPDSINLNFGQPISGVSNDPWRARWFGSVNALMPTSYCEVIGEKTPRLSMVFNDMVFCIYGTLSVLSLTSFYEKDLDTSGMLHAITDLEEAGLSIPDEIVEKATDQFKNYERKLGDRLSKIEAYASSSKSDHEDLLEAAREAKLHIEDHELAKAEEWIELGEVALDESEQFDGKEAEKDLLRDWLVKASVAFSAADSIDKLDELCKQSREENKERLVHLELLSKYSRNTILPNEFKSALQQCQETLSFPNFWPIDGPAASSLEYYLNEIISSILEWSKKRTMYSEDAVSAMDTIIRYLSQNILNIVSSAALSLENSDLEKIAQLEWATTDARALVDSLGKFGLNEVSTVPVPAKIPNETPSGVVEFEPDWIPLIDDVLAEKNQVEGDIVDVQRMLKNENYSALCGATASVYLSLVQSRKGDTQEAYRMLSLYGLAYAITVTELPIKKVFYYLNCAAYYLDKFDQWIRPAFSKAVLDRFLMLDSTLEDRSGWNRFAERSLEDPARNFASDILSGRLGKNVIRVLWEKGKQDKDHRLRIALLCMLDDDKHWDNLAQAIESYSPPHLKALLLNFAHIRRTARGNANLPIIAERIVQQAKSLSSTVLPFKPWTEYAKEMGQTDLSTDPLQTVCQECDELESLEGDKWLLQLRITPRAIDYPSELKLTLGEDSGLAFSSDGKPIQEFKVAQTELNHESVVHDIILQSRSKATSGGKSIRLPIQLSGLTLTGQSFRQNAEIDVRFGSEESFIAPNRFDIEEAYPGSKGRPVLKGSGFVGRDDLLQQVEFVIRQGDSLWVSGIRRVGKTSVLLQVANDFSHMTNRKLATIYVTLDTFNYNDQGPRSYQAQFLSKIKKSIMKGERNRGLRDWFENKGITRSDLSTSLGIVDETDDDDLSSFLPELARTISKLSDGYFTRVLFLFDEIEKLEEQWGRGHAEQVKSLLASLRSVIQHCEILSVIIAGSNLANRFISEYDQPFNGSIEILRVTGFDLVKDASAGRDVFLPGIMRNYFSLTPVVLDYVMRSCNGIPYFLSILGQAVVKTTRHRAITRNSIDYAIKALMWGNDTLPDTNAHTKFTNTMQDLKVLSKEEELYANIFMLCMAEKTHLSFPEVSEEEVSRLAMELVPVSSLRTWQQARRNCAEEARLIEGPRVRLTFVIPIMGEALRRRAKLRLQGLAEDLIEILSGAGE